MRKEDRIEIVLNELKADLARQARYIEQAKSMEEEIKQSIMELHELRLLKDIRDSKLLCFNAETLEPVSIAVVEAA